MADSAVIQTSALASYFGSGAAVTTGTAGSNTRVLPGVVSGNALIATIAIYRDATSAGELVSAVSDNKGNTWVQTGKVIANLDAARYAIYEYAAYNVAAGSTTVSFTTVSTGNRITWQVREVSNLLTSSVVDFFSFSGHEKTGTGTLAINTIALAQAGEFLSASMVSRYWFMVNGGAPWTGNPAGIAPTSFTLDGGTVNNSGDGIVAQFSRKRLSEQAAQTVSWVGQAGEGALGLVVAYKETTTSKRVKVTTDADMNGQTAITAFAWSADPTTAYAVKWTGLAAEATGGILYMPLASGTPTPPNWAVGAEVMVVTYNESGGAVGAVKGTVENA